jgi:hypothetical protein
MERSKATRNPGFSIVAAAFGGALHAGYEFSRVPAPGPVPEFQVRHIRDHFYPVRLAAVAGWSECVPID